MSKREKAAAGGGLLAAAAMLLFAFSGCLGVSDQTQGAIDELGVEMKQLSARYAAGEKLTFQDGLALAMKALEARKAQKGSGDPLWKLILAGLGTLIGGSVTGWIATKREIRKNNLAPAPPQ